VRTGPRVIPPTDLGVHGRRYTHWPWPRSSIFNLDLPRQRIGTADELPAVSEYSMARLTQPRGLMEYVQRWPSSH
jgi:hypothetical protein